ncbi:hypothetical protein DCCM_3710 [Desulfocucumis palustris]|uniref:Uncharacterized protein n=1 Tax=Desulfocucumis palustris TaxID=1898651 RepID=A0A2L2XKY1_9FIRM|nr:hypothetical protein DCCM_3710 [Desulfocucumis palustris]
MGEAAGLIKPLPGGSGSRFMKLVIKTCYFLNKLLLMMKIYAIL